MTALSVHEIARTQGAGRSLLVRSGALLPHIAFLMRALLMFLVFAVPLGTKKFLASLPVPLSNFYTMEYASVFLFGTDLIILALLGAILFITPVREFAVRASKEKILFGALAAFLFFAFASIFFAAYPESAWYAFGRTVIAIAAGLSVWWAIRSGVLTVQNLMAALALSAAFQAVVAISQFVLQRSIGLRWLGEPVALGPHAPGVATIAADGVHFLRAYGTLPHANVLAGFLVIGLLALCYWFLTAESVRARIGAASGIALVQAGLLLSFSRSGWIAAGVSFLVALSAGWRSVAHRRRVLGLVLAALTSLAVLVGALHAVVVPRAAISAAEGPVRDRWIYNEIGAALIAERPWGVGIGNQLFHSYDRGTFNVYGLTARGQWQPIHNLYLLMASEIGVLGLLSFLAFVFCVIFGNPKHEVRNPKPISKSQRFEFETLGTLKRSNVFRVSSLEFRICLTMFMALLGLGLFDHFLWDLQAGRLTLWVVIGIMLGRGTHADERGMVEKGR